MKIFGVIILIAGAILGVALVGSALNLITIPWLRFNSQIQMNRDIIQKTYDADNALYNYHWFKERSGALKAEQKQIIIADNAANDFDKNAGVRRDWTFEDKTESSRLHSVAQGLRSDFEYKSAEYNAKMKEVDRAKFEEELPLFFSL